MSDNFMTDVLICSVEKETLIDVKDWKCDKSLSKMKK